MTPELVALGQIAAQYGPLVVVIGILMRSNAKKDEVIEKLAASAMRMAEATKTVVERGRD